MSPQRPQTSLGFNSPAHPPSYRTDFLPLHPDIQHDQPETGHRSDIEDQHQHKRYMLTDSPPASLSSEEEDWLVKPIPQSWFSPRQQSGESLPEFWFVLINITLLVMIGHLLDLQWYNEDLLIFHNLNSYLIMHMAIVHLHRLREILI